MEARFLVKTAQAFGCFPTDVLEASAENMRYINIVEMGTPQQKQEMETEEEWQIQSQ
jgi:hypothetical protein